MIDIACRSGVSFRRQERAVSIPRQTLYTRLKAKARRRTEKPEFNDNEALVYWITEIKAIHPAWGIRRVRAFIRKHTEIKLGRKRTTRILREKNLLCSRIKKRVHRTAKKRAAATAMNQLWATDMTSFMLTSGVKVFLVVVLDIFTRRIVGWHLNRRCRAKEWLAALNMALCSEFPEGPRGKNLTLRMDNGCQPTSSAYIDALTTCEIAGEWIGFNSPEQNAHVESVIGTLKQDWLWLEEYDTFEDALKLCQRAVEEYNSDHPHSNLEMLSPNEFTRLAMEGRVRINENKTVEILPKAA
jgi:transposase InsO family protein